MAKNCKLEFLGNLEEKLLGAFTAEQVTMIVDAVSTGLYNYDLFEKKTEIVEYDNRNERIMKRYLACLTLDGKSEKTIAQYKRSVDKLMDAIGNIPYTEVGVYEIRYYLASEKQRGVSETTLRNQRANISAFYEWLFNEDYIPKNPCKAINPPKKRDKVKKAFSEVELDALRSACKNLKERAILEFLLTSGIRVNELCEMEVSDIDFQSLKVHVRHGKGDKERITYTNDVAKLHLLRYLKSRKNNSAILFTNFKNEKLNPGGVRHILRELGKRAGVENVHPHRFRRTFATILASRGMKIQEIQKLLGHSDISTTLEYISTDDNTVKISYQQHIA